MYNVYAVKVVNGEKERIFIESVETMLEAKHTCNVYTLSWADYAYVKDTIGGGTVFYLDNSDQYEQRQPLTNRPLLSQPLQE